ncbi:MAG: hypothetical protein AB8E82_14230 [Aureispira sp.]
MSYKNLHLFALLIFISLLSFVRCSNQKNTIYINELSEKYESNNRLERITNLWVGHFSNKIDTANKKRQEIIGRRVWKENRVGEYWAYIGWFQANAYESALSSSIIQITKLSPDTALIAYYQIKDEILIDSYEWKKDNPFQQLKKSDLKKLESGCKSFIVARKEGTYEVLANTPCYSPMDNKVKYHELNALLSPTGILFSTKLLDEKLKVSG